MRRTAAAAAMTAALVLVGLALPTAANADTVIDTWSLTGLAGSVAVSPDGTRVYVALNDSGVSGDRIVVLDANDGSEITSYSGPSWSTYAFGIALSADGSRLYAVSEETDQLFAFDTTTGAIVDTIATGNTPRDVELGSDGRLYVANQGSGGELQVFTVSPLTLVDSIPIQAYEPFALVLSPDASTAYVSHFSGGVAVVDIASSTVTATVPTGSSGRGIAITADGSHVAVATFSSDQLVVIDTSTLTTEVIAMASAYAPAYTADGSTLYAARFTGSVVEIVDTSNLSVIESVTGISGSPRQIAIARAGDRIYVTSGTGGVTVIDSSVAPTFATAAGALAAATVGIPYSASVYATGIASPSYSVTAGALPAGIVLDSATGALSGTPTSAGSVAFQITATNGSGSDVRAFTIAVASAPGLELADTGAAVLPMTLVGCGLLVAGAALFLRSRRVAAPTRG